MQGKRIIIEGNNSMPARKIVIPDLEIEEIRTLRASLMDQREQLSALYKHDVQVGQEASDDNADDSVDRANNSFSRELMFALSDTERGMLIEIEDALIRIEKGGYGSCVHCESPIGLARLNALPWARYCISCQELDESGILEG